MEARELVQKLQPEALVRELSSGANKVFRVIEGEQSTIVKVYPVASRERRERHALEALAGLSPVPKIIDHGTQDEMAWLRMSDGGHWNLANLPKNLDTMEAAGAALRDIHSSDADITNGNSGSPTFNARGELVGLAFDGNYEAMASDWIFLPKIQRTIHADIRYILWVLDILGGDAVLQELGVTPSL